MSDHLFFWVMLSIQVLGVISAILSRMSAAHLQGTKWCRNIFLGCLVVLGLATMYAIGIQSGHWAYCGTTFSLMAVGGTWEAGTLRATGF